MKLIICQHCGDIVNLVEERNKFCECGKSWGRYTDDEHAVIGPDCIPFGLDSTTFVWSMNGKSAIFNGFFYYPRGMISTDMISIELQPLLWDKEHES